MIIYTAQAAEEEKKKRDGFVVVAQSKLLCLYFISVCGDCWRRLSHEPAWPRFELTRLAPSRGRARIDWVRRVTGCVNPMSLLLPLFPDAQMPSPPAPLPPPPSWHLSSWHHQAWGVKMQSRLHARHSLCAHRASLAPRAKQAQDKTPMHRDKQSWTWSSSCYYSSSDMQPCTLLCDHSQVLVWMEIEGRCNNAKIYLFIYFLNMNI